MPETFKLIFEQSDIVFSILQNKLTAIGLSKQRFIQTDWDTKDLPNK